MSRNSLMCESHYQEAWHFCICQGSAVYLCRSCMPKHENQPGHELFTIDRIDLYKALDRDTFKQRVSMHDRCMAFFDRVTDRETAIQAEAAAILLRLTENYQRWLDRRHNSFQVVIEMMKEEVMLLLSPAKSRVSALTQAIESKWSSLGDTEEQAFARVPEAEALCSLIQRCEEACSSTQRVWQNEFEDEVLCRLEGRVSIEPPSSQPQFRVSPEVRAPPQLATPASSNFPYAEMSGAVPDYLTPASRAALQKFGPFAGQDDEPLLVKRGPILLEGGFYIGQWNSVHQRHGFGKQFWPDGKVYEGSWCRDERCGKGRLVMPRGDVYEGDMKENAANGYGMLADFEGNVYVGSFLKGKRAGIGSIRMSATSQLPNARYFGEWQESAFHGAGVIFEGDGSLYAGSWKAGSKHGKGMYCHQGKDMYCGDYQDNLMYGVGVFNWISGHIYRGQWQAGKRWGQGRMSSPSEEYFEGPFAEDRENGTGVFHFHNGRSEQRHYRMGQQV